ncbi:NUDIX domain-containing protein [Kitasatospora sp. NPDC005856]|uniref:NUDIX domain-containing protein n=1 Tax=Kitasatospora sp. NPDC005856 TaxID=3154566 RepID=UPI0033FB0F52
MTTDEATTTGGETTTGEAQRAAHRPFSHCHFCGTPYPPGTRLWPRTCPGCAEISYRNPLPVAVTVLPVTLPDADPALVVIRRTIEPGYGELAFPGGYMDYGESWQQACVRELHEETGISADPAEVTLIHTASDPNGRFVMLCGLLPARPLADLPPSRPTDETDGWLLATAETPLVWDFHNGVLRRWFGGEFTPR